MNYSFMIKVLRTNKVLSKTNIYMVNKGYSYIHLNSWFLEGNTYPELPSPSSTLESSRDL